MTIPTLDWKIRFFLRKNVTEFFNIVSPFFRVLYLKDRSSKSNKARTIGNSTSPELFRNIKFEENKARNGLQTATQRLGQKSGKKQNKLMRWQKWEASLGRNTPISSFPYKPPTPPPPPKIFSEKRSEKSWRK